MTAVNVFFSVRGRIAPTTFWLGLLPLALLGAFLAVAARVPLESLGARLEFYYSGGGFLFAASDLLFIAFLLLSWWVLAALAAKRLHDRGKSGWWALVFVGVPAAAWFIGIIVDPPGASRVPTIRLSDVIIFFVLLWGLIELGILGSKVGPNRFGPDPLNRQPDGQERPRERIGLPGIGAFVGRGLDWKAMIVIGLLVVAGIVFPLAANSPDSTFYLSAGTTILVGKYLCFALLALAVGLVWGYGGILSLGHAAFFALGGYAMGMYLMRQIGTRGVYGNAVLPDFMVFLNWDSLPWFWTGFNTFWFAALCIVLIPGLIAFLFGWFAFRSRVTGVYLSIITQALTFALWQAFLLNEVGFGGNNGFTDFKDILGANIQSPSTRGALFAASAISLAVGYWICRSIVASKYGKVLIAVRDAESRARFLGYRVDRYKLFVFTISACMAGIAGALYVPQAGIINPGEFAPARSIEAVVWVAVGGRGTLVGPIIGGIFVNWAKSYFTTGPWAEYWLFILGGMFVAVTLFLPKGIVGTVSYGWNAIRARRASAAAQKGVNADINEGNPDPPDPIVTMEASTPRASAPPDLSEPLGEKT